MAFKYTTNIMNIAESRTIMFLIVDSPSTNIRNEVYKNNAKKIEKSVTTESRFERLMSMY